MRYLFVLVLLVSATIVSAAPKTVKLSLTDGLKSGFSTEIDANAQRKIVIFHYANRPSVTLQGKIADVWLVRRHNPDMLGGIAVEKPIIVLAKDSKGEASAWAYRFMLGCVFVDKAAIRLLDWDAVKKWESAGGYAKVGMPKKDDYNPVRTYELPLQKSGT
jgi:hypothetical protein